MSDRGGAPDTIADFLDHLAKERDVSPNTVGSDPTSIASYLESQARVIASDSIKTRVIGKLGLDKDPDYGGPARGGFLSGLLGTDKVTTDRNALLYALAALDRTVVVHRGERTFVIDIAATARDAEQAARIANALAEAYLEDQAAVRAEAEPSPPLSVAVVAP